MRGSKILRYALIYNPVSGVSGLSKIYTQKVADYLKENGMTCEVYHSDQKGDLEKISKEIANGETPVRIYAVGGDGTLLDIMRGVDGKEGVEIGIFPTGSGNDYIRNFGSKEDFLNIKNQINGKSKKVNLIDSNHGLSANVCSIGFDAKVAFEMAKFKNLPLVSGSLAYDLAVAKCFMGKVGDDVKGSIFLEDEVIPVSGRFLFALCSNGQYYGGGYHCAPTAKTDDDLLDIVLIKKPPLAKIPKMVQIYKKGEHLDSPMFKDYLIFYKGKGFELSSEKSIFVNCDGECKKDNTAKFMLSKKYMNFIIPQKLI